MSPKKLFSAFWWTMMTKPRHLELTSIYSQAMFLFDSIVDSQLQRNVCHGPVSLLRVDALTITQKAQGLCFPLVLSYNKSKQEFNNWILHAFQYYPDIQQEVIAHDWPLLLSTGLSNIYLQSSHISLTFVFVPFVPSHELLLWLGLALLRSPALSSNWRF